MTQEVHKSTEKSLSKEITVVAYLKADEGTDLREACDEVHDDRDFMAQSTSEYDKYVLVEGDWWEKISKDAYQRLDGVVGGSVSAHHFVKETESYDNSKYLLATDLKSDVCDGVKMANENLGIEKSWGKKAKVNDRSVFKVRDAGVSHMGMLKHQSEAESGDMWEDEDRELPAAKLIVEIDSVPPSIYKWFDDKVVPEIVDNVATHDWVSQFRLLNCEREVTEEGVCYDL